MFYYLTYEGEAKIEAIDDPVMRQAILDQVANYGQTPTQLFASPHLKRNPSPVKHPFFFSFQKLSSELLNHCDRTARESSNHFNGTKAR